MEDSRVMQSKTSDIRVDRRVFLEGLFVKTKNMDDKTKH